MTDHRAADERLRAAFQSLGETSQRELSPAELDQIWQAVSGELSATERRALVDRTARDPALAEAWRVAQELWRASQPSPAATAGGASAWTRSWLPIAAVLLIGVAIGLMFQRSRPVGDDTYRDPGQTVIQSLVEPDTVLPRDAFRLRWTPGPDDARYQVRVTTEDLRMLTTVSDLTEPEVVLEREVLSSVAPGARVFWQVDVTLPDGEHVSSQTFVVRVQEDER